MLRIPMFFAFIQVTFALSTADTVVQIPVGALLKARAVTTLTDGKLVTWTMGIDGNGGGDGYLTQAASTFHGDKNIKALPDDALIPADARHPAIQLHYANEDGVGNQTRDMHGADSFTVPLPPAVYSKVFLIFTSSEGSSTLTFTLTYADSTATKTVELPDYFNVIAAGDANCFNLVNDLAKWSKTNAVAENNHHFVDGVELHPAGRVLKSIKVAKTAKAYVVFWGATGIATGTVSARLPQAAPRAAGASSPLRAARYRLRMAGSFPASVGPAVSAVGRALPGG